MKYYASRSNAIEQREIDNMALARSLASECMVLLENDGALPIAPGKIALFGSGVRKTVKGGTGSGDVNTRSNVNVEAGMKEAGFEVASGEWLDRLDAYLAKSKEEYMIWAEEKAAKEGWPLFMVSFSCPYKEPAPIVITDEDCKACDCDTAMFVLARNSGEGADRKPVKGDYFLFDEEKESLEVLGRNFKQVILVLNIGGVIDLTQVKKIPGISAILLMSQLGNITGSALADVVTGKVSPSGKLTDTWAKDYMDYPSSENFSLNNGNVHDDWYTDGIYVGYRYFDSFEVEPEYSFGYGISYTTFSIEPAAVCAEGSRITVKATVTNTGDTFSGKEVVQVYVSAPEGKLNKPYQELVAYTKTSELAPGASEEVAITFNIRDCASYSEAEAAWILEEGSYLVRVGNSSADTVPAAALVLEETVKTVICKNILALDCEMTEIEPEVSFDFVTEDPDLPTITIDAAAIEVQKVDYQGVRQEYTTDKTEKLTVNDVISGKCTVEELVAQMTVEEMADLCVGTLRAGEGSIVGNASSTVPGAAGDTSTVAADRGVIPMILADGPAGLRLQPHFKTDFDGNMLPGGNVLGDAFEPFDPKYDETNSVDYYQYCTAIPIGWALAQSWNTELVARAGDMVGGEMEQFNVDLWLAPAMNIHRNPLCGRNFEYYSEDPVVSGRIAGAMTLGVQKHAGKGTTIKHYALNNQEEHRYFTNAHVSERAAREIYLKGFGICVRETQPLSVMTSYNLINGVHAACCYDTIQSVLRDEFGFKGFVMTDWFTSQDMPMLTGIYEAHYPISASTGCIYAGNDNQQPGCRQNVEDIIKAVNSGEELDGFAITKADLQFNAANIIRIAMECAKSSQL